MRGWGLGKLANAMLLVHNGSKFLGAGTRPMVCVGTGSGAQGWVALSLGADSEIRVHAGGSEKYQEPSPEWGELRALVLWLLTFPGLLVSKCPDTLCHLLPFVFPPILCRPQHQLPSLLRGPEHCGQCGDLDPCLRFGVAGGASQSPGNVTAGSQHPESYRKSRFLPFLPQGLSSPTQGCNWFPAPIPHPAFSSVLWLDTWREKG